ARTESRRSASLHAVASSVCMPANVVQSCDAVVKMVRRFASPLQPARATEGLRSAFTRSSQEPTMMGADRANRSQPEGELGHETARRSEACADGPAKWSR